MPRKIQKATAVAVPAPAGPVPVVLEPEPVKVSGPRQTTAAERQAFTAQRDADVAAFRSQPLNMDLTFLPWQFNSGAEGFFATGKHILADGERYQLTASLVRIGSKPKAQ